MFGFTRSNVSIYSHLGKGQGAMSQSCARIVASDERLRPCEAVASQSKSIHG